MFTIDLLPAQRGDCLWLTYGNGSERRHVIVDGGPSETIDVLVPTLEDRLKALPKGANRVELLVITHIDADHIQGIVPLLSDPKRLKLFRDIWFNGFEHLAPDTLGAVDGERLTASLDQDRSRWNNEFDNGPVAIPDDGPLPPPIKLRGGLEITLLSPTPAGLEKLAPEWEKEAKKHGLIAGHGAETPPELQRSDILGFNVDALAAMPYKRDKSKPNLSSIAFIARFGGRSVLCAADAHSEVLMDALDRLGDGPHEFTAVKLSHHGSKSNLNPKLLERVRSKNWLISTNGAKFHHPHPEALARVIKSQDRPVFHLNHVTEDVEELIGNAGDDYTVKLPRKLSGGGHATGISVKLA